MFKYEDLDPFYTKAMADLRNVSRFLMDKSNREADRDIAYSYVIDIAEYCKSIIDEAEAI